MWEMACISDTLQKDEPYVVRWSRPVKSLGGKPSNYLILERHTFMLPQRARELADMLNQREYTPQNFCSEHVIKVHQSVFKP